MTPERSNAVAKFAGAWQMREKHQHGPPQALIEAWTERRALEAVLRMLAGEDCAGHQVSVSHKGEGPGR